MEISMDGLTGCDNHVWKGRESRMKKKKYGWPRRCLSLICVMVLISMIVLQSVPVTYVSGSDDSEWLNMEPDPFTSEPEGNLQMTETSNMEPEQENNPFSDGTTSDGVTEVSEEPQLTETPEVPPTEVPEVSPTETPEISPTEIPEPSPTEKPDNADAEVTKYDYQSDTDRSVRPPRQRETGSYPGGDQPGGTGSD